MHYAADNGCPLLWVLVSRIVVYISLQRWRWQVRVIYDPRQVPLPTEPATLLALTPRPTACLVPSEKLWNSWRLLSLIQMVTDFNFVNNLYRSTLNYEGRGSRVSWGTILQARKSRVRFPMRSLDFSIDLIVPGVDSASNSNEYQESSWG
jgi:hypothetical protein